MSVRDSQELLERAHQRLNHHPTYLEVIDAQIMGELADHVEALSKKLDVALRAQRSTGEACGTWRKKAMALEAERSELLRFVRYAAENSERGFERAWDDEPYEVFEKAEDLAERFKEVRL